MALIHSPEHPFQCLWLFSSYASLCAHKTSKSYSLLAFRCQIIMFDAQAIQSVILAFTSLPTSCLHDPLAHPRRFLVHNIAVCPECNMQPTTTDDNNNKRENDRKLRSDHCESIRVYLPQSTRSFHRSDGTF